MNKVIMSGRLCADPETRQTANGTDVTNFRLAVDRSYKKSDDPNAVTADFFSCVCFGARARFVAEYMHTGTKVMLTGRVQNDNYTNANGEKRYNTQITVDEIEFAESKRAAEAYEASQEVPQNQNPQAQTQVPQSQRSQTPRQETPRQETPRQAPQTQAPQNRGYARSQNGYQRQNQGYGQNRYGGYDDGFMPIPDGVDDEELPFN